MHHVQRGTHYRTGPAALATADTYLCLHPCSNLGTSSFEAHQASRFDQHLNSRTPSQQLPNHLVTMVARKLQGPKPRTKENIMKAINKKQKQKLNNGWIKDHLENMSEVREVQKRSAAANNALAPMCGEECAESPRQHARAHVCDTAVQPDLLQSHLNP